MFHTVECSYNDPKSEAELNAFYSELGFATQQASGLTTRIRCFGSPAQQIYARN